MRTFTSFSSPSLDSKVEEAMRVLLGMLVAVVPTIVAHMPAFAGVTSREEPLDLGDITQNSWAITGTLSPGEVQHYKFSIASATTTSSPSTERFHMGLYVPGMGEVCTLQLKLWA